MKQIALLALGLQILTAIWNANPAFASEEAKLWAALRSGTAFAIMRHALAPGTGDPENFKVGDCSTQRNLSDIGRKQASKTGDRFRRNGIKQASVFTSQWCRCRETAELLELGGVEELPALNSFFGRFERRDSQTAALRTWLREKRPAGPLVLSTHQVNISALTGQFTSSGEIIVAQITSSGTLEVLGSLQN